MGEAVTSPHPHPATIPPDDLLALCDRRFTRRSGPGGQNRNKVETAVILAHRPTGISAEANERRTQGENLRVALFRLRLKLALEARTAPPEGGPSPLWRSRCRDGRLSINPEHDDFPALLAEALDWVWASHFDIAPAAGQLQTTPSQLVKLLRNEPRALAQVNLQRKQSGLNPYH